LKCRRCGITSGVTPEDRAILAKAGAVGLGFDRVGIAAAAPSPRAEFVRDWLDRGYAGSMSYLHRNLDKRLAPGAVLPGAKSIIVVAMSYARSMPHEAGRVPCATALSATKTGYRAGTGSWASATRAYGRVARYACGADYHKVVRGLLRQLIAVLRAEIREPFDCRICVDTAPILERETAAAAGIGWIGKNTLVLHENLGSFFVLGEVITTLELAPDLPVADRCGTCTRCLDACPTRAFPQPHVLDARRCISYLTIEHRGGIPADLRRAIGNWLYGCDICQEVCPYNRRALAAADGVPQALGLDPSAPAIPADDVLSWTPEDYARILAGSALKRATLDMWKRNATIVLENAERAN